MNNDTFFWGYLRDNQNQRVISATIRTRELSIPFGYDNSCLPLLVGSGGGDNPKTGFKLHVDIKLKVFLSCSYSFLFLKLVVNHASAELTLKKWIESQHSCPTHTPWIYKTANGDEWPVIVIFEALYHVFKHATLYFLGNICVLIFFC